MAYHESMSVRNDHKVLDQTYSRLLFLSVINNFAALPDFPKAAILEYMQRRWTTDVLSRLMANNGLASKSFAENLLRCAIETGNAALVKFLLSERELGLDVNKNTCFTDGEPRTLLERAVELGKIDVIKVLLTHGANVNGTEGMLGKYSILHFALRPWLSPEPSINTAMVLLLVEAQAEVSTHFMKAVVCEKETTLLQRLIDRCPQHVHTWVKDGIYHDALYLLHNEAADQIVDFLYQAGADLNWRSKLCYRTYLNGELTFLEVAARAGNPEVAHKLLNFGVELSQETIIHAIKGGSWSLIRTIIEKGHEISKDSMNSVCWTKLSDAIVDGLLDLDHYIVQNDTLRIGVETAKYRAALDSALQARNKERIKVLLSPASIPDNLLSNSKERSGLLSSKAKKALDSEQADIAIMLIDAGASQHHGYDEGHLSIYQAVELRNLRLFTAMFYNGAHGIEVCNEALCLAVKWGEQSVIEELISVGARPDFVIHDGPSYPGDIEDQIGRPSSYNALNVAIDTGDVALTELLLDSGPGMLLTQNLKCPAALAIATKNDDIRMVQWLLERGADPSDPGTLVAAVKHSAQSLQLLLGRISQSSPKVRANYGTAALQAAIAAGRLDYVKVLLEHGVNFRGFSSRRKRGSMFDYHSSETPLGTAIRQRSQQSLEIVQMLLKAGANPNGVVRFEEGDPSSRRTPLLEAIGVDNIDIVELLLYYKADVNLPATRGVKRTPLQQAAELGNFNIVELLIRNGACVDDFPADRDGATALQLAAIGGYVGIAELLVDHGADVNGPQAKVDGRSALSGAAEHGRATMVDFLIGKGAHPEPHERAADCSAIQLAKRNGHWAVAQHLEAYLHSIETAHASNELIEEVRKEEPAVCQECDLTLSNQSALRRHLRTVHRVSASNATAKYKCELCEYSSNRKDTFIRHKATHNKNGYVACVDCQKPFRKDYLKQHRPDMAGPCKDAPARLSLPLRVTSLAGDEMEM